MPKMIFRGAFVRHFDVRQDDEAGVFVRIHMTANFSKPVCDAMGWETVAGSVKSAKLDGELMATSLILTPNGELAKHEIQFDVKEVADFEFVRVKDDQEGASHTELRFMVRTSQERAEAILGAYIRVVGRGQGQLRIAYEKQGDLGLEEEKIEEPIESHLTGPALASHREMAGGTTADARKARQAKKSELEPAGVQ